MDELYEIAATLALEKAVLFAYLCGSTAGGEKNRDIDIAVYAAGDVDPHRLSADLKVTLHEKTGIAPDRFDIRILNAVIENIKTGRHDFDRFIEEVEAFLSNQTK